MSDISQFPNITARLANPSLIPTDLLYAGDPNNNEDYNITAEQLSLQLSAIGAMEQETPQTGIAVPATGIVTVPMTLIADNQMGTIDAATASITTPVTTLGYGLYEIQGLYAVDYTVSNENLILAVVGSGGEVFDRPLTSAIATTQSEGALVNGSVKVRINDNTTVQCGVRGSAAQTGRTVSFAAFSMSRIL